MKIELKNVSLAYSELTKKVYLIVKDKNDVIKDKKDITLDFHLMITNILPEQRYTKQQLDDACEKAHNKWHDIV